MTTRPIKTYRVDVNGVESLLTVERYQRHKALGGGQAVSMWVLVPGIGNTSVSMSEAISLLRQPGSFLVSYWNGYMTIRTPRGQNLWESDTDA